MEGRLTSSTAMLENPLQSPTLKGSLEIRIIMLFRMTKYSFMPNKTFLKLLDSFTNALSMKGKKKQLNIRY